MAAALPAGLTLTACTTGGGAGPSHPSSTLRTPPAPPTRPPATSSPQPPPPADLQTLLLRRGDLPSGFTARQLTSRNLPSDLTGCAPLQQLTGDSIGRHAQAEFFQMPIGPWIDEAVIAPAGKPAATLTATLAKAIAGCSSVTVTEGGQRVRLALTPATVSAAGDETHGYHATGTLGGIPLDMDIVLIRTGGLVLLVTNTSIGGTTDPALTATATRAAAARAAHA
jgi:hypothetical protein